MKRQSTKQFKEVLFKEFLKIQKQDEECYNNGVDLDNIDISEEQFEALCVSGAHTVLVEILRQLDLFEEYANYKKRA